MKKRIEKLENARQILKSEFVGLDEIIDKIITAVTPWYATPQIIQRPVIVSLWGMTGTGKTSVINRLIELLDIKNKTMSFDCGKEAGDNGKSIVETLNEFFSISRYGSSPVSAANKTLTEDLVFVFDEFQYARTIDESGCEIEIKSAIRPVWTLMDTGILNLNEDNSSYDYNTLNNFIDDFLEYTKGHESVELVNGNVVKKEDVKEILENLGFFYYGRGIPNYYKPKSWEIEEEGFEDDLDEPEEGDKKSKKEKDPYRELPIIQPNILRTLIIRLRGIEPDKKYLDYINEINSFKTVIEFAEFLKACRTKYNTPNFIDCKKSLIFVLGNLDEAFPASKDLNPDIDADIFYDETRKVSISEIKDSLLRRFKPEQLSRIGNNIIKYPTLKKVHFEELIKKEIDRNCDDFFKTTGIKVSVTQDFRDLIYSEGVYPAQGVRPLFTTIGTIFTPIFSDILIKDMKENVEVGVKNPELGYAKDSVTIYYGDSEKTIPLELGKLRNPDNRKLKFASSVHEAGHAVVMSYLTGRAPNAILGVDSNKGGITIYHDSEMYDEIDTKYDLEINVMVSVAGYCAEEIIFQDNNRILLGSGSDLWTAMNDMTNEIYTGGFFGPYYFHNPTILYNNHGIPNGFDDAEIKTQIRVWYEGLVNKTKNIIGDNKKLIKNLALKLVEKGKMLEPEYLETIRETEGKGDYALTEDRMKQAKLENSYEFYERKLREI